MVHDIAKLKKSGDPRYNAIVTEVAGAESFATKKDRVKDMKRPDSLIKNYKMFTELGFKEAQAMDANEPSKMWGWWQGHPSGGPVWMALDDRLVPYATVKSKLSLPKMHNVCPEETRTGGQTACRGSRQTGHVENTKFALRKRLR